MKRLLLTIFVLAFPLSIFAAAEQPKTVSSSLPGTMITNADLSTSPTTPKISVAGYSLAMLKVQFNGAGSASDLTVACEESDDGSTNWSLITQIQNGAITQFSPTFRTSVSVKFTIRLDVTGFLYIRCTFSGTGATSDDKVTLPVRLVRGI